MSIFVWSSAPSKIFVWDTEVSSVWVWDTKVRPTMTPWIYHDSVNGLISLSSDWSTRYTISDKNLWATTVWNSWDALSQSNCWKYYQRWNNYWFKFTWSVTTSSTEVNASTYWPWNYYSSSTFIKSGWTWDSSNNKNLWWWETWTNAAMQWPCDSWFHVPTHDELKALKNIWTALWGSSSDGVGFAASLKMPLAWERVDYSSNVADQGSYGNYWSCIATGSTPATRGDITFGSSFINTYTSYNPSGESIRPFKNEVVIPDSTWTLLYPSS